MTPRDPSALPFVIDAFGRFPPECVSVSVDPAPRPTSPALEALITEEWERQTVLAKEADRLLFNGSLFRYVRHTVVEPGDGRVPRFEMTVGPTCYRDFVGTNLFNHHRFDEFDWRLFSNPIGTTATLITSDGQICYGRRSDRVAYHAGCVHTFGGGLEERDVAPDGSVDPFRSLYRELGEELNLGEGNLHDLVCVGLIRDTEIHQPEMLFEAGVDLTVEQIRERWGRAEGRDEHDEIVSFPDRADAIVPFIRACGLIAPVAIGALFLHGRLRWGEDWFRTSAAQL